MGRVVVTCIILLLILALSLTGIWYAARTKAEMEATIVKAEALSRSHNRNGLLEQVAEMEAFWKGREPFLSFYVRHDEIEKMNVSLINLRSYAAEGAFDSVAVTLGQIQFMAGHIYERELPNMDNLL